ncbi:hypothetical protein L195_g002723 [Trifolium pratense]|uniref:Uncharacterized protein n=1 Tax=Trifolium pratense TaxID=57577 RepID=A0A2K3NT95_TRIPR|nr:hypothetical protein L195_g002723 [Trifolium pratense]
MANKTDKPFHPALAVTNIKNFISITLEMEKSHYPSWAELFKIHCRAYEVIDHIIPPPVSKPNDTAVETSKTASEKEKEKEQPVESDPKLWSRLDAIVLQWIYGTISTDLLHTILEPNSTAQQAWERLENIFQDNKNSRAVYLENQFANVNMNDFPNISAYCQEVKMLADQLASVGSPVSEHRLVLQLIAGLNENYDGVATLIQQHDSLPHFYEARSKLILEETRKTKQAAIAANAAGTTLLTTNTDASSYGNNSISANRNNNGQKRNQNRNNNRGKNGGNRGRGRGGNNHGRGPQYGGQNRLWQQQQKPYQWAPYPPWEYWGQQPWAAPPCPYPTSPWTRPPPTRQPGNPSNRSPQAYSAQAPNYAPTDIDTAMQNLSLNVPDENWYMDTGATSHMTSSQGTLSPYFNMSTNKNIVVGSGQEIPIHGYGQACLSPPHPPLTLNNVMHAPKLIKNLISVRRFTIDNNVSIEFDPFGFSVKDIQTGMPLMRCNSTGDLYPITKTTRHSSTSPSTFAAISSVLWHNRLGHPGAHVLNEGMHPLLHHHLQNEIPQQEPDPNITQPSNNTTSNTNPNLASTLPSHFPTPQPTPNVPTPTQQIASSPIPQQNQTSSTQPRTIATRSMHGITKPKRHFNLASSVTPSPLPCNPKLALSDPNWKAAMADEFDALIKNKTWELVPRPPDVNVIRSMWIFRHKKKSDGSFERHKARLVGDGRSQQVGMDCDETFSPVVKPTTIRTVLTIALSKAWTIHQLDVKNTFLHGHLHETVYMHQPMGFRDADHPDYLHDIQVDYFFLKENMPRKSLNELA